MSDETPAPAAALDELSERLADDLLTLDKELVEVDLLIAQAKTEAARHEGRRVGATEKLAALSDDAEPKERIDALTAIITLTKRAALMETQVDVLEGKRRALGRYRDSLASYIDAVTGLDPAAPRGSWGRRDAGRPDVAGGLPARARRPGRPAARDRPGDA
jgi:hypothetical protein